MEGLIPSIRGLHEKGGAWTGLYKNGGSWTGLYKNGKNGGT